MENNNFFDELEKTNTNKKVKNVSYDNSKIETIKKENNTISLVLKAIAWIILILGFIMGFILGVDEYDDLYFPLMLEIWCLYGIGFLITYAFAEIIQILHDIRLKVWK